MTSNTEIQRHEALRLVHDLYNLLNGSEQQNTRTALRKVYRRLQEGADAPRLVNRLVNYINQQGKTKHITYTSLQQAKLEQLTTIGELAGINAQYRGDVVELSQL